MLGHVPCPQKDYNMDLRNTHTIESLADSYSQSPHGTMALDLSSLLGLFMN